MSQADVIKFRAVRLTIGPLTTPIDGPEGAGGSPPTFTMSPTATSGLPTGGFLFMLKRATGGADGNGGFELQVALRDPNTFRWGLSSPISSADYDELWRSTDINACDVQIQINQLGANAGGSFLDLHFAEVQA